MDLHHIEWARQHDWFRDYHHNGKHYVAVVRDDVIPAKVRVFHSYSALRAWAGY